LVWLEVVVGDRRVQGKRAQPQRDTCRITHQYNRGSQPVVSGPLAVRGHLPGGKRARDTFLFCKDINTQTDQFWQFSAAQFSMVVCEREKNF